MMDMTWLSAILVGAGCLALGYIIGTRGPGRVLFKTRAAKDTAVVVNGNKKMQAKQPLEVGKLAEILEYFKLVFVVRNDIKMGKGKIAAQSRHATFGLYKKILHWAPKALNRKEQNH